MRKSGILMVLLMLAVTGACAAGGSAGDCDPTAESCACDSENPCPAGWVCSGGQCVAATEAGVSLDSGVVPDGDGGKSGDGSGPAKEAGPAKEGGVSEGGAKEGGTVVDSAPVLGNFGDPCTKKLQCKSKICIFAGTKGTCSRKCPPSCGTGYGCYGVLDAIEQGKVGNVCVPESTMLCTPCKTDNECTKIGQDLCLDDGFGDKYCGRDCSKVSCPSGYSCKPVTVSGSTYKQCMPASGSCTCGPSTKPGTTKQCTIKTPFGNCAGKRPCNGASGWGSCAPPAATDTLDGKYLDDNCDGIDGDIKDGIFVATSGSDSGSCGAVHNAPCLTINKGISRAKAAGRSHVYVQSGQYKEVVALLPGVHIIGGYDTGWKRGSRGKAAHKVTVVGGLDSVDGQYMAVRAHNLSKPTTIMDLVLWGANASGSTSAGARSSHVIHADTVMSLTVQRVTMLSANGANGLSGTSGADAPIVNATSIMNGGSGGKGYESFKTCDKSTRGSGGKAGANSCGGSPAPSGGGGGYGGTMDNGCTCLFGQCTCLPSSCDATSGSSGSNASYYVSGSYGYRGSGGAGKSSCGAGGAGQTGRAQNGAAGSGGSGGYLSGSYWFARSGSAGKVGKNGSGGGGGGGSGGCDVGTDSSGAGGGGGAAGGCAATKAGGGGVGGGGSFGVLAVAATITLSDCEIQLGNGGKGGAGGLGGQGQSGGKGGAGGAGGSGASNGGNGGSGAHGGHAGGGGGGAGGVSYGIYGYKSIINQSCTFSGGSGGGGGAGGKSAPNAPLGERDGNPGKNGASAPGPQNMGSCASPGKC